ncbi:glycosyltransferase family 2 protein [Burkholderia ubonensis]|uniref:glycosyltransferase family 2 protein n=1 Tax=Burkholderia ubonensis TaxID=101571 RepID=UPI0009B3677D|nr:glycosyltransferase family A protein [Burkholderia ubonensis]
MSSASPETAEPAPSSGVNVDSRQTNHTAAPAASSTQAFDYARSVGRSDASVGLVVQWLESLADAVRATNGDSHSEGVSDVARPFLSIVVRTRGERIQPLTDVLACLAGQTCTDFEVLVIAHRVGHQARKAIQRVISDEVLWLQKRIRLIEVTTGSRAKPLNTGFDAACGRYVAILDDDDLPLANWVDIFRRGASERPGMVVRSTVLRQNVSGVRVARFDGVQPVGPLERQYPAEFDLVAHFLDNHTPCMAVAFPREAFHSWRIRFDEEITTAEDWDFLMRVAVKAGVHSVPDETAIYQWWVNRESSRTQHAPDEWRRNYQRIVDKLDSEWVVLPPGTTRTIRRLVEEHAQLIRLLQKLSEKCSTS